MNTRDKEELISWSLRLPPSLLKAFKEVARDHDRSASAEVRMLMLDAIHRHRRRARSGPAGPELHPDEAD